MTPLSELKALLSDAEAVLSTPSHKEECDDPIAIVYSLCKIGVDIAHFRGPHRKANAKAYTQLMVRVPALIARLEAAERVCEAAERLSNNSTEPDDVGTDDYGVSITAKWDALKHSDAVAATDANPILRDMFKPQPTIDAAKEGQ